MELPLRDLWEPQLVQNVDKVLTWVDCRKHQIIIWNITGSQLVSKSNSKFWFWPLKTQTAWASDILRLHLNLLSDLPQCISIPLFSRLLWIVTYWAGWPRMPPDGILSPLPLCYQKTPFIMLLMRCNMEMHDCLSNWIKNWKSTGRGKINVLLKQG